MRLHTFLSTSILAVGLCHSAAALAAPVLELEADGTAINNTLATAQVISAASFTPDAGPTVFGNGPTVSIYGRGGNSDVDFYRFSTSGGSVYLDIDNNPFALDSSLALFNAAGTLIAFSDDSWTPDPGSVIAPGSGSDGTPFGPRSFDPFIGVIDLKAGDYYAAVSSWMDNGAPNWPTSIFAISQETDSVALTRPDGAAGGFSVFNTAVGESSYSSPGPQAGAPYILHITQVPEPGTIALLGTGLLGLGFLRRRKPA